jgi:prepilin-type N-terminal cleavage/methylation domain-containing protein/prepilin-type processing-associated H-X9-DG protein
MYRRPNARGGFTLVELLVVISIIGVLMGLLLPAINAARESGRKTQCLSNLKQLGLGALEHEEKLHRYPSGGWGPLWVGYADGGNSTKQPGGWFYNLLPYLDSVPLHDLGQNETNDTVMQNDILRQAQTTQTMGSCPTRRSAQAWPMVSSVPGLYDPLSSTQVTISNVARGDYAANAGVRYDKASAAATTDTENMFGCFIDPANAGTNKDYPAVYKDAQGNVNTTDFNKLWRFTGVIFQRSTIGPNNVKDGVSKTYLFGEKFVDRFHTEDGGYFGDQTNIYTGMGADNYRTTCVLWNNWPTDTAKTDGTLPSDPSQPATPVATGATAPNIAMLNDQKDPNNLYGCLFGSAHSGIANFVFCDGSTKSISVGIDPLTHRYLGERNDGKILDDATMGLQ